MLVVQHDDTISNGVQDGDELTLLGHKLTIAFIQPLRHRVEGERQRPNFIVAQNAGSLAQVALGHVRGHIHQPIQRRRDASGHPEANHKHGNRSQSKNDV